MSTLIPVAESHDNRGDDRVTFGFVYFDDGRRVAYEGEQGAILSATGGWEPVTEVHVEVADRYLNAHNLLVTPSAGVTSES